MVDIFYILKVDIYLSRQISKPTSTNQLDFFANMFLKQIT